MGRIAGLIRWWRSLNSVQPEALAAPLDAESPAAARKSHEQRNEEVAAALIESQRTRLQLFLGSLGFSALIYGLWSVLLGLVTLVTEDKFRGSNVWDVFPASGWTLGLSTRTAEAFVFAALALVAAVTIAISTSRRPEKDSDPVALAGWSGWLSTLALTSLLASTMALAVAGSQLAVRPKNSVLLIFVALLACWLSSGIRRQADERIENALEHSEKVKTHAFRERVSHKFPAIGSRDRGRLVPAEQTNDNERLARS